MGHQLRKLIHRVNIEYQHFDNYYVHRNVYLLFDIYINYLVFVKVESMRESVRKRERERERD